MKHHICRAVLAAATVTVGVFLSACGLFRDTTNSVLDEAEDTISTDREAADIETAEFLYRFGDGKTATVRYQAPNHVRIDVLDDERTAVFCLNGASGWMYVRGDVFDMTAEDIAEMHATLLQAIPFNVNFQDIFSEADLQPETEDACGEECNVVLAKLRRRPDVRVKLWLGKKTDLLRQFEVTEEDGVHTVQYFNYRSYDGVVLPSQVFKFSPEGASKITLVSLELNNEFPAYVFLKPQKLSTTEGVK